MASNLMFSSFRLACKIPWFILIRLMGGLNWHCLFKTYGFRAPASDVSSSLPSCSLPAFKNPRDYDFGLWRCLVGTRLAYGSTLWWILSLCCVIVVELELYICAFSCLSAATFELEYGCWDPKNIDYGVFWPSRLANEFIRDCFWRIFIVDVLFDLSFCWTWMVWPLLNWGRLPGPYCHLMLYSEKFLCLSFLFNYLWLADMKFVWLVICSKLSNLSILAKLGWTWPSSGLT